MMKAWVEKRKREEYNFYKLEFVISSMMSENKEELLTYDKYINKVFEVNKPLEDDFTREEKANKSIDDIKKKFMEGGF